MLRSESVISLHKLQAEGKSIRGISQASGHARNTVRKYLRAKGIPQPKQRRPRPSKLDPFKPLLEDLMKQGIFNCEVMLRILKEQGYTGSHSILREYIHPFRPPKQTPAVCRYETKPGEHAQVDWGICEYIDLLGQTHKVPVFVMVLGYSRVKYIEFTKRCDIHSFLRCLIHGFEYFGGVPKIMLTDRMKTVIVGMDDNHNPKWQSTFADFAATIGLVPQVCRVKRPQTKGKVERVVRYAKENFLPGRKFIDLADLNVQAKYWCDEVNRKVHSTTGERPIDRLALEQLTTLPAPHNFLPFLRERRQVSKDGYVSYDGVLYGVPWRFSGREVYVREIRETVEIWTDGELIAIHQRQSQSGTVVTCPNQYTGLTAANGYTVPKPVARQIPSYEVQTRPPVWYDHLVGVLNHD